MMNELLNVSDLTFSYDGKRQIFRDISFDVQEGEVFCIVGPNGCGKSTLIDCVLGLNRVKTGSIQISGMPIGDLKPAVLAQKMAYVPQGHKTTFGYTVLDVVTMGRTYAARMFSPPGDEEREIARKALERVGLSGFEDREYTHLSGGELQLVLIARAIAQDAQLLVMDEPTAHLDFTHELTVMEVAAGLVKETDRSILMATHFLNQPFYLENEGVRTRVGLMNHGRLVQVGTPEEVLSRENLEQTFNIIAELATNGSGERTYILPLRNKR